MLGKGIRGKGKMGEWWEKGNEEERKRGKREKRKTGKGGKRNRGKGEKEKM